MSTLRQRKMKGKDWTGYEWEHGTVLSESSVGKWKIRCKHCNDTHIVSTSLIKVNGRTRSCPEFKPYNWSGLEKDDSLMRNRYGITLETFNKLCEFQDHKCGICNKPLEEMNIRPNIDHDHNTGIVRGILCTKCNTAIGALEDNAEGVRKALEYLENTPYAKYANPR